MIALETAAHGARSHLLSLQSACPFLPHPVRVSVSLPAAGERNSDPYQTWVRWMLGACLIALALRVRWDKGDGSRDLLVVHLSIESSHRCYGSRQKNHRRSR